MSDDATNGDRAPLAGVRVLELGQLIAGPFAGQMLAAFGADVVKVEPPGKGDPLRGWRALDGNGTSWWWQGMARGKRSIAVDLRQEAGRDCVRELIGATDVVLENFRPGRLEAWGLGPDAFRDTHPELIWTRVSGYGQTGPYAGRPGFASACEAMGGMRYLNGHPGEPPVRMNLSLGDSLAALHAVIGTLLSLLSRRRDGEGRVVDVSIVESVFAMLEGVQAEYDGAGLVREPSGTTVTGIAPTNSYACRDGRYLVIGGNGDTIFERLMRAIGAPDAATDPRFADNAGRVAHEDEIDASLAAWCAGRDRDAALDTLIAAEVPCGPINSIADIARDPHFAARGAFETVRVGEAERRLPAAHPRLSGMPPRADTPAPGVGEHTEAVLADWLDATPPAIAARREAGAFG